MTQVTILQPTSSSPSLIPAQPLHVAGTATGKGGLEPVEVDTVTVSVDGAPPVAASLTIVPKQKIPTVRFAADVQVPSNPGPHEIRVVAIDGGGARGTATVTVVVQNVSPAAFTPQDSLQVSVVNPAPPSSGDWAAEIVKANQSPLPESFLTGLQDLALWREKHTDYPICAREWVQVTDPANDYDIDTVGFSGWLLQPEISKRDVPFTHPLGNQPFGVDWECMVALDPEYAGLLAAGNIRPDGADGANAVLDAKTLGIKIPDGGLLAVETDSGCVPSALKPPRPDDPFPDTVRVGDRIAVFGRWIADSAHHVDALGGTVSYRSEVHPPLLMAIGGTRPTVPGDSLTRIVLTSRPYLVKQVYTTDTGTIYEDSAPDDGTLLNHLNNEMDKLTRMDIWHVGGPDSTSIEAHPKIASKPFQGTHLFRLTVRPPAPAGLGAFTRVEVSFQFTCRSGVGVQVVGLDDHVDVLVSLNSATYQAPPLPPHHTDMWTKDRLKALDPDPARLITFDQIASILTLPIFRPPGFGLIDLANAEQALARGVETEHYDVPDVDALDRSHAVPFVPVTQIPASAGVVIDDSQPYPVFGFLEIRRHRFDVFGG
jgi:hypothetical protein